MTAAAAPAAAPRPAPSRPEAPDPAIRAFDNLKSRVRLQSWIIGALAIAIFALLPFAQPVDVYFARMPDGKSMRMTGLVMPNMTNRAVLAWSTTTITELMTMGFGDIDAKLPKQKWRFTPAGWKAFVKAFVEGKIGETFKQNQLVLTTVPSNTPVITGQGLDAEQRYIWVVQMPVIMTYATNDNVTRQQRGIVTLTLVRVPVSESPAGIAIDSWLMAGSS